MSSFRDVKCPIHGIYNAEITIIGKGEFERENKSKCPECEKDKANLPERELELKRLQALNDACASVKTPKRYQVDSLFNIKPMNDAQGVIIDRCKNYVEKFNELEALGTSLVFTGKPGTGKTMIALSMIKPIISRIINAVFDSFKKNIRDGNSHINDLFSGEVKINQDIFKYVNTYDLFMEVKATYNKNSLETERDVLSKYTSTEILIIDEVGAQSGTDYETTTMFRIINARYENMKPTFLISNLSEADLSEYIGERTIDRFYENHGAVFVFDWESNRRI